MLIILQNESSAWMDDKGAKRGEKVDATHHREHTAKPQENNGAVDGGGSRRVNNTTTTGE